MRILLACDGGNNFKFPLFGSPKIDGIRCHIYHDKAVTRSLKPIPNKNIYSILSNKLLNGLDGELTVGNPFDKDVFNKTTSVVSKHEDDSEFNFYIFDITCLPNNTPYLERKRVLEEKFNSIKKLYPNIYLVKQTLINNEKELLEFETKCLEKGYEGIMLRSLDGLYKQGRSTLKEGYLLKLKRFKDSEATIVGFEQKITNTNLLTKDLLGYSERSSKKQGLVLENTLGSLIVKDIYSNTIFNIGSGFTNEQRKQIWEDKDILLNKIIKYKYFPIGIKDKPRFPIYLGFRMLEDI